MGRSPPIRSKRAHLKLATHPTFSDVGHEALSSTPKKDDMKRPREWFDEARPPQLRCGNGETIPVSLSIDGA
jgi:hypothetical protein